MEGVKKADSSAREPVSQGTAQLNREDLIKVFPDCYLQSEDLGATVYTLRSPKAEFYFKRYMNFMRGDFRNNTGLTDTEIDALILARKEELRSAGFKAAEDEVRAVEKDGDGK